MSTEKPNTINFIAFNTAVSSINRPIQRRRIAQDYLLIWFDDTTDQRNKASHDIVIQLQSAVNDIDVFTDPDEFIDFISDLEEIKVYLVLENILGQRLVPVIHNVLQLHEVYILCHKESQHQQWTKEWNKIMGTYIDIKEIGQALQNAVRRDNQDNIALSFVPTLKGNSHPNINQLEPTFMYTQIFKEILLKMKYSQQMIKVCAAFCRAIKPHLTETINQFEDTYTPESAISWYTSHSFLYEALNYALRTMEADTIITMSFFVHDLHSQIKHLYQAQVNTYQGEPFFVYRGQGLLKKDFDNLLKTEGGLMSFNNFLSTSKDRDVSLMFATSALQNTDLVGILFILLIDPRISTAPFALIRDISYFEEEEEILFTMHTVFRVGPIIPMDNNQGRLYQVKLQLTADDDEELRALTNWIAGEVTGNNGWERLGDLLLKIGQFYKAEELYKTLLEQTSDESEKVRYYHQLGVIKNDQCDYLTALCHHEKAIEIIEKTHPVSHLDFTTAYNDIGVVHMAMGDYSRALTFYEKALEIHQKILPTNHRHLAICYNNIGKVYFCMGDYSQALLFDEKALKIHENILPVNHPHLAISYSNIAVVYESMREYSIALSFYEKALEILQKSLPPNHHHLAIPYNNIAGVYVYMGEYSKALALFEEAPSFFEKALSYYRKSWPFYEKALLFYEKALEIYRKTLPENHLSFAHSYDAIGMVYHKMGEHSKALSFLEKALDIRQKIGSVSDIEFAASYRSIGAVYRSMGEHLKALSFFEKAHEIFTNTLPANHPLLATSYTGIGAAYMGMNEFERALPFFEKAAEIRAIHNLP